MEPGIRTRRGSRLRAGFGSPGSGEQEVSLHGDQVKKYFRFGKTFPNALAE